MKKYCQVLEIKPECVEQYVEFHKNAWPEFLEALRDCGLHKEVAYLYGNKVILYMECEDIDELGKVFYEMDVWKRWDAITSQWFAGPGTAWLPKIYDVFQQIDGGTLEQF